MSSEEYIDKLSQERMYVYQERKSSYRHNLEEDVSKKLYENWANNVIQENSHTYDQKDLEKRKDTPPEPLHNDQSPEDEEIGEVDGHIDVPIVKKFLEERQSIDISNLPSISKFTKPISVFSYNFKKPDNPVMPRSQKIQITPSELRIAMLETQNVHIIGFFQLYDVSAHTPISEQAYFDVIDHQIIFHGSEHNRLFFSCPKANKDIVLLAVILRSNSEKDQPVLFALQVLDIFDGSGALIQNISEFNRRFYQIEKPFDECLKNAIEKASGVKVADVLIKLAVGYDEFVDEPSVPFYCDNKEFDYRALNLKQKDLSPVPLSFIRNLSVILNGNKGDTVFFKASISSGTPQDPKTEKSVLDGRSATITDYYTSIMMPITKEINFPDIVAFMPTENIMECALFLQFFESGGKEGLKLLNIGAIPVKDIVSGQEVSIELFKPKDGKDMFQKLKDRPAKKKDKKGTATFTIDLAGLYYPPKNYIDCKAPEYKLPKKEELAKKENFAYNVALSARLLGNFAEKSVKQLFKLWTLIQPENLEMVRAWILNVFNPEICDGTKLMDSFEILAKAVISGEKKPKEYDRVIAGLAVFIDLIFVYSLDRQNQFNDEYINKFFGLVPELLSHYKNENLEEYFKVIERVNSEYSYVLMNIFPSLQKHEDATKAVAKYLESLSELRLRAHPTEKKRISKLQFAFLSPFAYSKHLLVGIAREAQSLDAIAPYSPYARLPSDILLATKQTFGSEDPDSIALAVSFFSTSLSDLEEVPVELRHGIAQMLFPLIDIISGYINSSYFTQNRQAQLSLIPIVVFLLNESSPEMIKQFFHSLSISFKKHFIDFLIHLGKTLLQEIEEVKPSFGNPKLELNLFDQLTTNLFFFLKSMDTDDIGACLDPTIQLISTFCGQYQPTRNYPLVFDMCTHLIDNFTPQRGMAQFIIDLVKMRQHSARALGTALAVYQINNDISKARSLNMSYVTLNDALVTALLEGPIEYIDLYTVFVNDIEELADKTSKGDVALKMKQMRKNIETIREQKVSTLTVSQRTIKLLELANTNYYFPPMRLKWLREMVRVNQKGGDPISAAICQLHAAALVATVYEKMNPPPPERKGEVREFPPEMHLMTTQPIRVSTKIFKYRSGSSKAENEFDFFKSMSDESKKTDVSKMDAESQILLADFNKPMLIQMLKETADLFKEASMFYTLRPISSLLIRLLYSTRSYKESEEIVANLADYMLQIGTNQGKAVDVPLVFFMVEKRDKDAKKPDRRVFCCRKVDTASFLRQLSEREKITVGKLCERHSKSCEGDGICVVPLEAINTQEEGATEGSHSWNKFRTIVSINQASINKSESVERFSIKTKYELPFYYNGVPVHDIKSETVLLTEICENTVKNAIESVDALCDDFETYLRIPASEYQDSPEILFGEDIARFPNQVKEILIQPNCAGQCAKALKEMKEGEAMILAEQLVKSLNHLLFVYRRAIKELEPAIAAGTASESVKAAPEQLKSTTEYIKKFATAFEMEVIPEDQFMVGELDPMRVEYEYEKEY